MADFVHGRAKPACNPANGGNRMNTNDFYQLKKSYDTSQMPEKEVIKMKEKMNQAKAEKKNKHNKTIIT